jgi:hypothetical protein
MPGFEDEDEDDDEDENEAPHDVSEPPTKFHPFFLNS